MPANVTKEGGAEIEDIATGPQNTQLMTMLSQKKTQKSKQTKAKHLTDDNAITNSKEKKAKHWTDENAITKKYSTDDNAIQLFL